MQPVVLHPERTDLLHEVAELRDRARAGVTEVDLLIAALRDNLEDLRREREQLLQALGRARAHIEAVEDERRREGASWLWRGMKQPRG